MENNVENNISPADANSSDKSWETFISGGLGALIAGFADWKNNQSDSIVAEMTRLMPFLGEEIIGLGVIVVLGVSVCWVFRPATRIDGFARGLAILALIGIPTENNLDDDEPEAEPQTTSMDMHHSDRLLASIDVYSLTDIQSDCPDDNGEFEPNATILSNNWVSSSKPETKWYSSKIFVDKCGEQLDEGQRVQKLDSFETFWKGYYYIQIRYKKNGVTRIGWIYSGRTPNYWQKVQPDSGVNP